MPFHETDIQQLVSDIWTTMLGLDTHPCDQLDWLNRDEWIGHVKIHGARELAVSLSGSDQMARMATAAMFDVNGDAATSDLLRDTWGELTNMVAGAFKSLLPGHCFLGLPTVTDFGVDGLSASNHRILTEVGFHCGKEQLRVTIVDLRSTIRTPANELANLVTQC